MSRINFVMNWPPSGPEREVLESGVPAEVAVTYLKDMDDEQKRAAYAEMHAFAGMVDLEILENAKNLKLVASNLKG